MHHFAHGIIEERVRYVDTRFAQGLGVGRQLRIMALRVFGVVHSREGLVVHQHTMLAVAVGVEPQEVYLTTQGLPVGKCQLERHLPLHAVVLNFLRELLLQREWIR